MAREVKINILGDASRFNAAVGNMGRQFAAIGTGAAAAGVALYKVGEEFDSAYDKIRVGTGATGDALEALKDDFRAIAVQVPSSFDEIGTSVADLNTRLGITGTDLQELSVQMLNLSRITDTDLGANIESVTRLFGDWAVATEDQNAQLDMLFRASQATGPSAEHLSRLMVQFGAPMRQLGFSIEETAALLGSFEKEGVNTELVMGSLRQALGRMAREGEPAIETFNRVVESIAAAGSASEANALALELFGARAGPDMAAAIREGRFAVDDLVASISGGGDTINAAAEDTNDLAEAWGIFANQLKIAVEPAATALFNWLTDKLQWFIDTGWPFFTQRWRTFKEDFIAGAIIINERWDSFWERRIKPATEWLQRNVIPAWDLLWATFKDKLIPAASDLAGWIGRRLVDAFNIVVWAGSTTMDILEGAVNGVVWVVERLVGAIEAAIRRFQDLKNAARDIVSGRGFSVGMPSWWPTLPTFDSGGVMPGQRGKHYPAMVAGGETILPTHKGGFRGGGGNTYNITVHAWDTRTGGQAVVEAINNYERMNGSSWRG